LRIFIHIARLQKFEEPKPERNMQKIKITLEADLAYASLPIPNKMIIPIEAGKLGPLGYKQHDIDPLCAEQIVIAHGGNGRLKISVRVAGRIAIKNFPDLRLGKFKIEIAGGLTALNKKLLVTNPEITQWDMPNVPAPFDRLVKHLMNKFLLKKLLEALQVDLQAPLEKALAQINRPNVFEMVVGKSALAYEFKPNVESFEPKLTIAATGLRLAFAVTLLPSIEMIQPRRARTALRAAAARRRSKRRRRSI
jgi:hypothetical protein